MYIGKVMNFFKCNNFDMLSNIPYIFISIHIAVNGDAIVKYHYS